MTNLSIIVLTLNEEANITQCLESVADISDDIFVVDSGSTDRTVELARNWTSNIVIHDFQGYSAQRNWALRNLPFRYEWVLFLDADEFVSPELKNELHSTLGGRTTVAGFYLPRKLIFQEKWIRFGGYYPTWILRLVKHRQATCEDRKVNEHLIVTGATGKLRGDLIHNDKKGITAWISRHNAYATLEALELIESMERNPSNRNAVQPSFWSTQVERRRWLRERVWNRFPPLVRPCLYFIYRYFVLGGLLDGRAGFIYHFMQALWFPLLIDVKFLEMRRSGRR